MIEPIGKGNSLKTAFSLIPVFLHDHEAAQPRELHHGVRVCPDLIWDSSGRKDFRGETNPAENVPTLPSLRSKNPGRREIFHSDDQLPSGLQPTLRKSLHFHLTDIAMQEILEVVCASKKQVMQKCFIQNFFKQKWTQFQGHIENEIDLSSGESCSGKCSEYKVAKSPDTCYNNLVGSC